METKKTRRTFSPEFKKQAAQRVVDLKQKAAAVAQDLNISVVSLYQWIKEYEKHKEPNPPTTDTASLVREEQTKPTTELSTPIPQGVTPINLTPKEEILFGTPFLQTTQPPIAESKPAEVEPTLPASVTQTEVTQPKPTIEEKVVLEPKPTLGEVPAEPKQIPTVQTYTPIVDKGTLVTETKAVLEPKPALGEIPAEPEQKPVAQPHAPIVDKGTLVTETKAVLEPKPALGEIPAESEQKPVAQPRAPIVDKGTLVTETKAVLEPKPALGEIPAEPGQKPAVQPRAPIVDKKTFTAEPKTVASKPAFLRPTQTTEQKPIAVQRSSEERKEQKERREFDRGNRANRNYDFVEDDIYSEKKTETPQRAWPKPTAAQGRSWKVMHALDQRPNYKAENSSYGYVDEFSIPAQNLEEVWAILEIMQEKTDRRAFDEMVHVKELNVPQEILDNPRLTTMQGPIVANKPWLRKPRMNPIAENFFQTTPDYQKSVYETFDSLVIRLDKNSEGTPILEIQKKLDGSRDITIDFSRFDRFVDDFYGDFVRDCKQIMMEQNPREYPSLNAFIRIPDEPLWNPKLWAGVRTFNWRAGESLPKAWLRYAQSLRKNARRDRF